MALDPETLKIELDAAIKERFGAGPMLARDVRDFCSAWLAEKITPPSMDFRIERGQDDPNRIDIYITNPPEELRLLLKGN